MLVKTTLAAAISAALMGMSIGAQAGSIQFEGIEYASTDAAKRQVLASPSATVDGKTVEIGYNVIMRSGQGFETGAEEGSGEYCRTDKRHGWGWNWPHHNNLKDSDDETMPGQLPFGTLIDINGNPLLTEDGSYRLSNAADFNSLLNTRKGLFMVSHFEARPGAMYVTGLDQDKQTGKLTPKWSKPVDFSAVNGGWVHCAGSVTPWETHLGSEEYEPDASIRDPETGYIDSYAAPMADYFGGDLLATNPYYYGYAVEVAVTSEDGDTDVTKHYAMGRIAMELAYVMPDKRTVYLTDDGTNTALFMFVADRAGNLSSGKLYGAKVNQDAAYDGMAAADVPFALEWVYLGHSDNRTVARALRNDPAFEDLMDSTAPVGGACPEGYTSINAGHGGGNHQCLSVKPGMDELASRMETRRYAAMQGVTTEFRKMEGISFNPEAGTLFLGMSEVSKGMEDSATSSYDVGGPNDIRVAANKCGGVYAMPVSNRVKDTNGHRISSRYVATAMNPEVFGIPGGSYPNTCDLDGLANPDNVTYLPGYDTLIIGEDTGSGHQNDVVWSYNLSSKQLTRVLSTPYGSETTSPYWYPNVNGWGYLMTVVQHPYGESDGDKYNVGSSTDRAYFGYVGPFPALTK